MLSYVPSLSDYIQTLTWEGVFRLSLTNVTSADICNSLTRTCLVLAFLHLVCSHIMFPRACNNMSDDRQTPAPRIYKLDLTLANSVTVRAHYNDNRPHLYACFRVCTYEPPPRLCHGGCPSRVPSQQLHSISGGSLFMWGWQRRLPWSDTHQLPCPGVQRLLTWTMLQYAPTSTPPATA